MSELLTEAHRCEQCNKWFERENLPTLAEPWAQTLCSLDCVVAADDDELIAH